MQLIVPQVITLLLSNVTASTYGEWSAFHGTYTNGDNVKITDAVTLLENEYECLITHTAAADKNPETDTTDWLYLGASNKWKMFDDYTNTQTENASTIEITVAGESYVDTIAFFNLSASSVNVVCKSGTTIISDDTYDLTQEIADWYEYFFAEFEYRTDLIVPVSGLYSSLTFEITITAFSGSNAKCGHIVLGRGVKLGDTQYAPTISIEDYSAKSTNAFGETYLNQRAYAKTINAALWLTTAQIDTVNRKLATVRSIPCVWQFNNPDCTSPTDYESLIIYGFYKDFSIILEGPIKSACNLEIEGLI